MKLRLSEENGHTYIEPYAFQKWSYSSSNSQEIDQYMDEIYISPLSCS